MRRSRPAFIAMMIALFSIEAQCFVDPTLTFIPPHPGPNQPFEIRLSAASGCPFVSVKNTGLLAGPVLYVLQSYDAMGPSEPGPCSASATINGVAAGTYTVMWQSELLFPIHNLRVLDASAVLTVGNPQAIPTLSPGWIVGLAFSLLVATGLLRKKL